MPEVVELLKDALAPRYEVERELGRGGMAVVILGRDLRLERRVAIKVLLPELSASLGAERFLQEIRFAAALHHPHILAVHESGEAAGFLYYVMPYVEGESLRARLDREGELPLEDALRIAHEVGDALHYAHERDVVHRDVKPENILLSNGHAMVADFGIARAIKAASGMRLTETGLAVGTPAYMAPEQAAAGERIDARADVYALGCVLYEMLAGEPPYRGATPQRVIAQHATAPIPSLTAIRPAVPLAVEAVVTRALAKAPADRFPNARAFAAALPLHTASHPVPAIPAKSRRARYAVIAATALAVAAAGTWYGAGRAAAADDTRRISVVVAPVHVLDTAYAALADGLTQEITTALTRVERIAPRAYASVAAEAARQPNPLAIGRSLDADYVLATTLRRVGRRLRMTSELIRVRDGTNAWATRAFDGDESDLFRMQDSVTSQLVREFVGNLTPRLSVASTGRGRRDPEAYRLYLEAKHLNRISASGSAQRVELLTRAVERDSTFADAWAELAASLADESQYTNRSPAEQTQLRIQALNRALSLDSLNSVAWRERASISTHIEWQFDRATREHERAIQLAPSDGWAHIMYAQHLWHALRMRDSARAVIVRAEAVDPSNSHTAVMQGFFHLVDGQLPEAEKSLNRALALDPSNWVTYLMKAWIAMSRGQREEAIRLVERLRSVLGQDVPFGIAESAGIYAAAGDTVMARKLLDRLTSLASEGYVEYAHFATTHAALGDKARALDALEASANAREVDFLLALDTFLRLFPDDPRVRRLLRRTGLESRWLPSITRRTR